MQAFEIDGDAPIVALVGILRPRLFITRRVVAALTDEELAASVAHELGHRRALDNLKRLAMRTAPDFLATTSVAGALERRWASASEHVADRSACEMAALADRGRARCALASAIVKVARMMPPMAPAAEPICTLVDGGDIASRVRSLLDDGAPAAATPRAHRLRASAPPWPPLPWRSASRHCSGSCTSRPKSSSTLCPDPVSGSRLVVAGLSRTVTVHLHACGLPLCNLRP